MKPRNSSSLKFLASFDTPLDPRGARLVERNNSGGKKPSVIVVRHRSLQTGSQTGLFEVFYIDRSITPLIWNTDPFLYKTQIPSNLAIDPLLFASHRLCCSNLKRLQIFLRKIRHKKQMTRHFLIPSAFKNEGHGDFIFYLPRDYVGIA